MMEQLKFSPSQYRDHINMRWEMIWEKIRKKILKLIFFKDTTFNKVQEKINKYSKHDLS